MRKRLFRWLMSRQKGFTLIELLVAATILGTVTTALTGVTFSIFHSTDDNNGRVEAVTGIEVAIHQMAEDGMSAWPSKTLPIAGGSGAITLEWTMPSDESQIDDGNDRYYDVVYELSGTDLLRHCIVTFYEDNNPGNPPNTTTTTEVLARDITGLRFDPIEGENAFNVTITSTGGGTRIDETREYHVTLRPDV